jgi:hypothetical protein
LSLGIAKDGAVLLLLTIRIPFSSAYSLTAATAALVDGPMTIRIPFDARSFSFSSATAGSVFVSSIMSPTLVGRPDLAN